MAAGPPGPLAERCPSMIAWSVRSTGRRRRRMVRQVITGVIELRRRLGVKRILRASLVPALAALLAVQAAAPVALADQTPRQKAEAQASARKLGEDALRLYGEKKFAEAYEMFRSADELFHANTLVLFMGHCRREVGRLLEARDIYLKIVNESVPKGSVEQFKKAQATAQDELSKLKARIPTLRVTLRGSAADKAKLRLDGAPTEASELSSGKEIDPGEHKITAEAPGAVDAERTVTVDEGRETAVEIELAADPKVAAPVKKKKGSIVPGAVALGVGAAAAGAGAVTGFMAMSKIDDIKSRCRPDGHCLVSDQANADSAQLLKTISTIGFAAGGALLATGAVLLIVRPGGGKEAEGAAGTYITVGVGSVGVGGSF